MGNGEVLADSAAPNGGAVPAVQFEIPADADQATYLELAKRITASDIVLTPRTLRALLSEARSRRSGITEPSVADALEHLEGVLRLAVGAQRLAAREANVQQGERQEPLRRRLLNQLAAAPGSPTDLAAILGAANETVSRLLKSFSAEGLVSQVRDEHDRRRRIYRLTDAGRDVLNSHFAFGEPEAPPAPLDSVSLIDYLEEVIDLAVVERRRRNLLDDAIRRLRVVVREAERVGAPHVETRARNELATTLRQDDQQTEWAAERDALQAIATGVRDCGAQVALQANAHLEYQLGLSFAGGRRISRLDHLVTATKLYERLQLTLAGRENWRERKAWAIASRAEILREQTKFEDAIDAAELAGRHFSELGDPYGLTRCSFLMGFCLRLSGEFDRAWTYLEDAIERARLNGFDRFSANVLSQMGEVRRCQGEFDEARRLLVEAHELSSELHLNVTLAFVESALGALEYNDQGDLDKAVSHFDSARTLFRQTGHEVGASLNLRRRAAAKRELFARHSKGKDRAAALDDLEIAKRHYETRSSRAGLAACHVGYGRIQRLSEKPRLVANHCNELARLIGGNYESSPSLLMDPWIPALVSKFAEEEKDDQPLLYATTAQFLSTAERFEGPRVRPPETSFCFLGSQEEVDGIEMAAEPRYDTELEKQAA